MIRGSYDGPKLFALTKVVGPQNFEGAIPPGVIIPNLDAMGHSKTYIRIRFYAFLSNQRQGCPTYPKTEKASRNKFCQFPSDFIVLIMFVLADASQNSSFNLVL